MKLDSTIVNAESKNGVWDWFNVEGSITLVKYDGDEQQAIIRCTADEWNELIELIDRIPLKDRK